MVLETAVRLGINLIIPASFVDIRNPPEENLIRMAVEDVYKRQVFFITRDCENPEAAFRVGDMLVSQYFSIVTRWGEEGVDWDYVENVEGADQYVPWAEGFNVLFVVYDDATFWSSGEVQNRSWMGSVSHTHLGKN